MKSTIYETIKTVVNQLFNQKNYSNNIVTSWLRKSLETISDAIFGFLESLKTNNVKVTL